MKSLKLVLTIIFGSLMILAGVMHFLNPTFYFRLIPDFLPQLLIVYASGVVEILLGVGVFFPKYRSLATLGIFLLMLVFLPIHVWDVFRDNPGVGSKQAAYIRLPIQFVLIYWAWYIRPNRK